MEKNSITDSLGKTYEKLPGMVQFALIIIAFIIVYILVRRISKNVKTFQEQMDANLEQDIFSSRGEKLSYPPSEYEDLADEFYASMDGAGTYEEDGYSVIERLNNNLDFLEFKNAFGVRDGYTLRQWVVGDYDDSEIRQMNATLRSKGIIYKIG